MYRCKMCGCASERSFRTCPVCGTRPVDRELFKNVMLFYVGVVLLALLVTGLIL